MRFNAWITALICAGLAACANLPAPAPTESASATQEAPTGLTGWREAVITTHDADMWIDFLTRIAGWEMREDTRIDDGLIDLWDLPDTANGREVLMANTGSDRGFIRLVELSGVEQDWIRADARPWDTGGLFNLNVRVVGMWSVREEMLHAGWQGDSAPIQYTFGPFEVIEWIARGPDGVRLALIERLKPELEGWPHLETISRTFNSTQTVADMTAARAFYEEVLGLEIYLEHYGASKQAGPNVLGLTHEDAVGVPREVYILHPQGVNDGSIELVSFHGASGSDLTGRTAPHNFGLSALRFEVEDLDTTVAALSDRGAKFIKEPASMTLPPYGQVRITALTSPEGARLEFYEIAK